ncbi:glycerophosphodiester phosphodiesterase [Catalinimonas niigatensis]|uniref:glycerophosphodiester phosphodiesterase n=1 Tax=Catalinimonas niigatensis TaxID=1397264 RepID=UPI002666B59F|nr:glycerophosphodiester phosphodiesterase family protein [Catalinimonas niigatensis]WPP51192.1 glycerophosphodiester phosphodiesterase family protein [Catalinimonas niigatensis]
MKHIFFTGTLLILMLMTENTMAQFNQNKVIAHRGAWKVKNLPQNSIASLKAAIELGCEGSEFDVWMTADGVLVANHDADFEGLPIETTNFAELRKKKLPNGEAIPTAEQYLLAGKKQNKTKLIFEIKPSKVSKERTLEITEKSVDLVSKLKMQDWVDYISFDLDACKKIVAMDKNANVAYLNGDLTPQQAKDAGFFGLDYHYKVFQQHPEWIDQAKDLGLTINSWTVNDKETMRWMLDKDVDFITTDEPAILLEMVNKE